MFHMSPDDTGASAVWVAQRVPDEHITVVTNTFRIREITPEVGGQLGLQREGANERERRSEGSRERESARERVRDARSLREVPTRARGTAQASSPSVDRASVASCPMHAFAVLAAAATLLLLLLLAFFLCFDAEPEGQRQLDGL